MLPLRLRFPSTRIVKEHGVFGTGVPTSYSAANNFYFYAHLHCKLFLFKKTFNITNATGETARLTGVDKPIITTENARVGNVLVGVETESNSLIQRYSLARWNRTAETTAERSFYKLGRVLRSNLRIYVHVFVNTAKIRRLNFTYFYTGTYI